MDPLTTLFRLKVLPEINYVQLGDTATFECSVDATDIPIQSYSWIASNLIAKEARFSFGNNQRTLHVSNVKSYDNNTSVECTVTSESASRQTASGHIFVLPENKSPLIPKTDSPHSTPTPSNSPFYNSTGSPSTGQTLDPTSTLIIGLVSLGLFLIIISLIAYICYLKRDGRSRRKLSALITPQIQVNSSTEPSTYYNRELDNVSVAYARPVRVYRAASCNSSVFPYDVPRSPMAPLSPDDVVPNPRSQSKLYKQKQTTTRTLKHHRSMPSLSVTSRSQSTDGYEDMEGGNKLSGSFMIPGISGEDSHRVSDLSTSSIHGSSNHLGITSVSTSGSPLHYSNWSVRVPSGVSYENVDSTHSSVHAPEEFAYQNQRMGKVPSFEFSQSEEPRGRLEYASLYLEDDRSSPAPSQEGVEKTTYAKIRGIIKVFRTRRSTRVNIVEC